MWHKSALFGLIAVVVIITLTVIKRNIFITLLYSVSVDQIAITKYNMRVCSSYTLIFYSLYRSWSIAVSKLSDCQVSKRDHCHHTITFDISQPNTSKVFNIQYTSMYLLYLVILYFLLFSDRWPWQEWGFKRPTHTFFSSLGIYSN